MKKIGPQLKVISSEISRCTVQHNEKVKDKSEGVSEAKGVGKVGESFVQAAAPNVQAELSNEATPGKIVFEEVVLEAAIEAEDHVKKSEAAQAEAAKLQRDSPLALDSDKLKKEQEKHDEIIR